MTLKRRSFLNLAALTPALALPQWSFARPQNDELPAAIRALKPMTDGIVPISREERQARIAKAQSLMQANKIDAVFLEPGTTMRYFLDFDFFTSERMVAAVIPAKGEIVYICPKFEEGKVGELVKFGKEIRTWEEHESPYKVVAGILKDRGTPNSTVGIEERTRFFLFEGIRQELPRLKFVLADPVTAGCRMFKSPAELALMQKANDITIAAYKAVFDSLYEGMTQADFSRLAAAAHRALGIPGSIGANFAEASAFPHGSSKPQKLKEGDIILADGGCTVEGYKSDISRTIVFGKPSARQLEVWNVEKEAQTAAFEAAKLGAPCEVVDAAARAVITKAGFGPDYKYFSHRTGHGIGMDGHEWTNLVRGNKTPLQEGMCFSNEPGIYIVGEFGVRLEDCFYMTASGPKYFSEPSPSLDKPFVL
ncbi:M24 family metallopeptidase [Rhodoflexus caldus]|uniref:M24 family metallopeptidase n=1 Tax=Rhodoflexus caldus TaxID=2891236 RepID=UPI002029C449|nr:Xaa-Pro peptidase family protein [Rhodoflexus caldus]